MPRRTFANGDVNLSYIDHGGAGRPLIALHAYWMEASTWDDLASALAPDFRVFALDQRGHGQSDKPDDLGWDAYIDDLGAFIGHLELTGPVPIIGNSLGATAAFRFAARNPQQVSLLVNEEGPAVEDGDLDFMKAWDGAFPTRQALQEAVGERFFWSVEPSIRQANGGFELVFPAARLADNQANLNGHFWADWLATSIPALVVRGTQSKAVNGALLEEMTRRRPNTDLVSFEAGHVIHHDRPNEFNAAIKQYLGEKTGTP